MAELKHTFVKGRMNKDLDERLIPNGEYRDALNIQVSNSEGSDAGAIENVLGNEKIYDLGLTNATCIGTAKDALNKKIYWFVTSDELSGIYEYDVDLNAINPVLVDTKNFQEVTIGQLRIDPNDDGLVLRGVSPTQQSEIFFNLGASPIYNSTIGQWTESICRNDVNITCEDPSLEFNIPKETIVKSANDSIPLPSLLFQNINYTGETQGGLLFKFKYFTGSLLNFNKNYPIGGANIIDGLLFFTDGLNEPKVIDIEKFKHYSNNLKQPDGTILKEGTIVKLYDGTTRALLEEDICVAKKAPQRSPELDMQRTLRDGVTTASASAFSFYKDGALVLPNNEDPTIKVTTALYPASGWKEGDIIDFEFEEDNIVYEAALKINSIVISNGYPTTTYQVISYSLQPEDKEYEITATLREAQPIYELKFPRFAYRWKYKDNTYSTFSPFSMPAFIPREFNYDGKKGFNEGVLNDLRRLTLLNIDKGSDNVKSIDILLKFDDDNNVYIVETKKRKDITGETFSFEITKEFIKSTVPNLQLLRQWDNVPKKALTQEVVGNRIIYGNYWQNYNIPYEPSFSISPVITDGIFRKSIKSNRNLEVGVVYSDKFNRQTPILASDSSSYFLEKSFADKNVALSVKLRNNPPAWATHFKYFIKETSAEYYNLAADRFYFDDENGFCFISFPSSERNKITEDSYLLLKKQHGKDQPVLDGDNRYKVIDISASPPEFITERLTAIDSFSNVLFAPTFGDGSTQATKRAASTPVENERTIQIRSINSTGSISAEDTAEESQGINDTEKTNLKVGKYIKFTTATGDKTKAYKIKKVRYHTFGADECELVVEEPFGSDVNILYSDPLNDSSAPKANIGIDIFETNANAGDPEFEGRFFVKIQSNSTLARFGKLEAEEVGLKDYFNAFTTAFDGHDRNGSGVPSVETFVYVGGLQGGEIGKESGNVRIDIGFEMTNPKANSAFIDNIEVGTLIKFSNHDTIYRVGQTFERTRGQGEKRIEIIFKDENGEHTPLEQDIIRPGTILADEKLLTVSILAEIDEKARPTNEPAIFETEPVRSKTELDIYYENDIAYPIAEHGDIHTLNWYNCFSFGNGVESNRIRDDFNAPFIKNGVKASTVLEEGYEEEHKFNGVIWSGIINSKSSVNNSNQFIQAETITKDFLPSYGKIQKLHTWDNAMVIFLENKVLRVYANKSQLYDANGNGTLTSTNRVIGDAQEYNGEYGISNDPGSFAAFGFRCYFVDRKNGKVLRLSKDGITPISNINMNDFFRDRLATDQKILGSFDERNKLYNISFAADNDTVCFSESVNGWVTRKSFVPQDAVSINSKYFTFDNGNLWEHASITAPRNSFYGATDGYSEVQFEINDGPSEVKRFRTLGYEGSKGWEGTVKTNVEGSGNLTFKEKEGKYFANITGEAKSYAETFSNLDLKKLNFQGIGKSSSSDVIEDNRVKTKLSFTTTSNLNVISQTRVLTNLFPGAKINSSTVSINVNPPNNTFKLLAEDFKGINCTITQNGDGITVVYTHGISAQPDSDTLIQIPLLKGRLIKKDIEVTVNRTVVTSNCTSGSLLNSFTITGRPGQVYEIISDVFTPSSGFELPYTNVSIDNENISSNSIIEQVNGNNNEVVTQEYVLLQDGTTSISYTVTARADEIFIPNKVVNSKGIQASALLNENEQRNLKIIGEAGAIVGYKLNDGASDIQQEIITLPASGEYNISVNFTATDYNAAKTYTLTFSTGDKTDFSDQFGSKTLTFTREVRTQKKLQFIANHGDSVNNASKTKNFIGFGGQQLSNEKIELEFTLNSAYDYKTIRQPAPGDFIFSNGNKNIVSIKNVSVSVSTVVGNEHIVTLSFTVDTGSIDHSEIVSISIDDYVNRITTITIAYNDPNQGADYTGLFINSLTTIQGTAGATNSVFDSITYKITMASGKQLLDGVGEDALQLDEFKLYDASTGGNDVTEEYDDNNVLLLRYSDVKTGATIELAPKGFVFPNTNKTLYIRPSRVISEAQPATPDNEFFIEIKGLSPKSEIHPETDNTQSFRTPVFSPDGDNILWPNGLFFKKRSALVTETSATPNTKRLVQFTYKLDRTIIDTQMQHISKFAAYSNNNYYLIREDDNVVEEASAGTYDDITDVPQTITGPYVISDNGLTLTVNLLIDIEYITTNTVTLTTLSVKTPIDHSPDSYITGGSNAASDQFVFNSKDNACDSAKNNLRWKVYNTDAISGAPKIGSFISGELSSRAINPNAKFVNLTPPLWAQYRNPSENVYFKDFTNSKIYKLGTNGAIVDIMDLCAPPEPASLNYGAFSAVDIFSATSDYYVRWASDLPYGERPSQSAGLILGHTSYPIPAGVYGLDTDLAFEIGLYNISEAEANKFDEYGLYIGNYGDYSFHDGFINKKYSNKTIFTYKAFTVDGFDVDFEKRLDQDSSSIIYRVSNFSHSYTKGAMQFVIAPIVGSEAIQPDESWEVEFIGRDTKSFRLT